MRRRLVQGHPIRRLGLDVLNQLSFLAVVAALLAAISVGAVHVGRHLGLIRANPLSAFGAPADPTAGLDKATRAESGLAPPLPVAVGSPVTPAAQPAPEEIGVIPVPSPSDLARSRGQGTWLPILMYHYVRDVSTSDRVGWALSVSPDNFRKQVTYLKAHNYTPITMRDVDLILAGRLAAPTKPVALTFDDGYVDFYTHAAPILREAGFTATNYVPSQLVGSANYMTWSEIRELDAEGFEMAAHSQHHVDISSVSLNRARLEVFGSKADLEGHLGHPVMDWAYPYGGVNTAAAALVREAGFWSGATTQPGSWHDRTQLLYLSRVRMGGPAELQSMIYGITQPEPSAPVTPSPSGGAGR